MKFSFERIVTAILSAILTITPFVMDRNYYVLAARGGIDLNIGVTSTVNTTIYAGGSQIGTTNVSPNLKPAYDQVNSQISQLKSFTQNLYQNFGK